MNKRFVNYKYQDENYELVKKNNKIIVKDKNKNSFFSIEESEINVKQIDWKISQSKLSPLNFTLYSVFFCSLFFMNMYILIFSVKQHVRSTSLFSLFFLLYLVFFIFIHELGHITCFKIFKGHIDKLGFKFNYIFPSFFVRMNEVHLLNKYEALLVHTGGLLFSLILNNLLYFISSYFHYSIGIAISQYFSFDILWNSIPILNSDGYKILLTIFSIEEKKKIAHNASLIWFIKIINWVVVGIYTINFFHQVI